MPPPEAPPAAPAPPSAPPPAAVPPPPPRRHRRWWVLGGLAVGLPLAGLAAARVLLDGDALRARVEAAVTQATGRAFTLSGPVRLSASLAPTVVLEGARLANPPGLSRPDLFTARRIEVQLALLPLLSREVEVRSLAIEAPDLLLETDAQGRPNWVFDRPAPAAPATAGTVAPPAPARTGGFGLAVDRVSVEQGRIGWRDGATGRAESVALPSLGLRTGPEGLMSAEGALEYRGQAVALTAQGGPLTFLIDAADRDTPWPVVAALTAPGLRAELNAVLHGAARSGRLRVIADDAARLAPFLPPGLPPGLSALPEAQGLRLEASVSDAGPWPLRLSADRVDLGHWVPGLALEAARFEAGGPDAAAGLSAGLALRGPQGGGLQGVLNATLPSPDALRGGGPWPLRAALSGTPEQGGLALSLQGSLAGPTTEGADLALNLRAADLGAVGQAAGLALPALRDAALLARLRGGPDGALSLEDGQVASSAGSGEWSLRVAPGASPAVPPRLALRASLSSLDLDALAPPAAAAPPATPPGPAPAAPAAPERPAARRVIPDLVLPLEALRPVEGEAVLRIGRLRGGGAEFHDLAADLTLAGGRLRAEPLALSLPGGRLEGRLDADAAATPPSLALRLRGPAEGLDLAPLLAALGIPGGVSGRAELDTELTGRGGDLRALAGSLNGTLGLALANGEIEPRLLDALSGELRRLLPQAAPRGGRVALRCLALRLAAHDGVARPEAMLLETGLLDVFGAGAIDLGQERLDLRLLPRLRAGTLGISAPVLLRGSFAAPRVSLDSARAGAAGAAILGDLLARQSEGALAPLAEALRGAERPDCAGQLRLARGGRDGPVPEEAAADPQAPRAHPGLDLLRGLLGR